MEKKSYLFVPLSIQFVSKTTSRDLSIYLTSPHWWEVRVFGFLVFRKDVVL